MITVKINHNLLDQFKSNLPAKITGLKTNGVVSKISFSFDNLDYINKWLLQFADGITIIEPKELKVKRGELLNRMLNETS